MFPVGYMSDTRVTARGTHFQSCPRGPPRGAMDFYKGSLVEEVAKNRGWGQLEEDALVQGMRSKWSFILERDGISEESTEVSSGRKNQL